MAEPIFFAFCNEGVKNFSELFQKNRFGTSMSDSLRILSESTVSGIDLYDTWLDGIHHLTDESFKISRQVADGKQAEPDGFMNAYSQMYEKLADRLIQTIKDTAFESFEPFVNALKNSADFKNNGHVMKSLMQSGIDMSVSMVKTMKILSDSMNPQRREAAAV